MDFKVKIDENKPLTEVHMRIIEHSRGYELSNPRYGELKDKMRKNQKLLEDSADSTIGWAPYRPHGPNKDAKAFYYAPGECKAVAEYRRAKLEKVEQEDNKSNTTMYTCTWMVPSAGAPGGETVTVTEVREEEILITGMGSGNFKVEKDVDKEIANKRKELYEEAVTFANQRVPLRQIVKDLNQSLTDFYILRKEEVTSLPKPKKITFENVQAKISLAREMKAKKDAEKKKDNPL
jgi:hypothetical protein